MSFIPPPGPVPLAGAGLDRAAHRRRDEAWLREAFNADNARVLVMREGLPLVEGSPGMQGPRPIIWLGPQAGMLSDKAQRVFLGETRKGSPTFAIELPKNFDLGSSPIAGIGVFEEFRLAAMSMNEADAGSATTARALFEWHRRHGFCSNCGSRTNIEEAGWKRKCPDCGVEHFPRTDPVAIMLVAKGDKCLLGRQKVWPPRMWSCLAGFVEPGETIEQAAAREVFEESGVRTGSVCRYLFGQPWPFPSSLMIGLIIEAESEEISVDTSELETARWFTKAEMAEIFAGRHPDVNAPNPIAVAHHIMKAWLEA